MKELAEKHGVKPSTLRSRKNREGWTKKDDSTQHNHDATQKKNVATQRNTQKALEEIEENTDLTEEQKLFCLYYSQSFNATKSYQKAYGVDYSTAHSIGYRLLARDGIKKEINRIKEARQKDFLINDNDIMEQWMKQAFADVSDYVEFGTEEQTVFSDEDTPIFDERGNPVTQKHSFVRFKNQDEVDGTLIQEVKIGRDGPVIKLYDKQKALQELFKLLGGEQKLKEQLLKAQIEKLQKDVAVDTSTEDKLAEYFEKLGAEIDGSD